MHALLVLYVGRHFHSTVVYMLLNIMQTETGGRLIRTQKVPEMIQAKRWHLH